MALEQTEIKTRNSRAMVFLDHEPNTSVPSVLVYPTVSFVERVETFLPSRTSDLWGFPGGPVVKNMPVSAGDTGSIPGPGRFHVPRGS